MKNILAARNRGVLQRFAHARVLVGLDFDGTLAPIITNSKLATLSPKTRRLLTALCEHYRCIVISGRSQADTQRRIDGTGVHGVVGNHGIEPWGKRRAFAREVERWQPQLDSLARLPGVFVDNKVFSVAVHHRQASTPQARSLILATAKALGNVRILTGKQVVNILPAGAPDKGAALLRELKRWRCKQAIYVGDDNTDEDVFTLQQPWLLGIRVGARRSSQAAYYLRSQTDIDALMERLVALKR